MKKIHIVAAVLLIVLTQGCTTGSKIKHTINYYSVGEYRAAVPSQPVYTPVPVMRQGPVYIVESEPTITDLSKEITRKIYKKMQAAYYTN